MSSFKRKIELFSHNAKYFGIVEALAVTLSVLFGSSFDRFKQIMIIHFLKNNFNDIINKYKNATYPLGNIADDAPVWTFWAQGEKSMPKMVKKCVELIKRHSNGRQVYILDMENVHKYVYLDDGIYKLLYQGKLSYQHFSDLVRCALLYKYGGYWVDACIYLSQDIPKINNSFFTVHTKLPRMFFSDKWLIGFQASVSGNPMHAFLYDLLTAYHLKYLPTIDYLLMDYALLLAYEEIPAINKMIEEASFYKTDFAYTAKNFNNTISRQEWEITKKGNIVMRASYKWKEPENKSALYWRMLEYDVHSD